jgi:polyferredoxin
MVVAYDYKRGEQRGKFKKGEDRKAAGLGDCIDCNQCVHVCPTGIDIRNGTQLECINCTACIDACDPVMTKLGRPRGLIRYDSLVGFSGGHTRWLRPRTVLYFVLLLAGAAVGSWALSTIRPASLGVTRMTGAPYLVDEGVVRNQFLVRVVNKRSVPLRFRIEVAGAPAGLRRAGLEGELEIAPLGEIVRPLVLQQDRARYGGQFHFQVQLRDPAGTFRLSREAEFLGPEAGGRRGEARDGAR